MTNSHLLHELAGLFRDYEQESSGEILLSASLQFVSRVDPGVGEEPIMSEIYSWNGSAMQVIPEEIMEKMR